MEERENAIAKLLEAVAWVIFIGGFLLGCIMGSSLGYGYRSSFSIVPALICWASAFISGISFLGFAEIIKLLDEIKKK